MTEETKQYKDTLKFPEILARLHLREDSLSEYTLKRIGKRYLDLEDLKDPKYKTNAFPKGTLPTLLQSKYGGNWRGVNIMKDCMTLNLIQLLFQYLKPKTVLDIGSWTGASAMYFADQLDLIGVKDYQIVSVDISHECLHPKAKADSRIKFVKQSLSEYQKIFPPEFLEKMEHPVFISEDAHFNTVELLSYFNKYLKKGDFIIIEDTHPETLYKIYYEQDDKVETQGDKENDKGPTVFQFMEGHKEWRVDNYFAAYFGQYSTTNGLGYLAKVE